MVRRAMPGEEFVSCDWGSTSFRLRLVGRAPRGTRVEISLPMGVKHFSGDPPAERARAMERFLARQLQAHPVLRAPRPIVISGMASSNLGWRELPYARVPFPLDGSGCRHEHLSGRDAGREMLLLSGVRSADDVMRGEECALLGAFALGVIPRSSRRVVALLAGTHPKHAWIEGGVLTAFRTHLTGELFDVLSQHSLLASAIDLGARAMRPDLQTFRAGVGHVRAEGLSAALFAVRARALLKRASGADGYWFLSGVLIGGELREATLASADAVVLIGDALRVRLYREALTVHHGTTLSRRLAALSLSDAIVAGHEAWRRRNHGQLRTG